MRYHNWSFHAPTLLRGRFLVIICTVTKILKYYFDFRICNNKDWFPLLENCFQVTDFLGLTTYGSLQARLIIVGCHCFVFVSGYFLDNLIRYSDPDFLPNDQDILRSRLRTTGIKEFRFHYKVKSISSK